MDFLASQTLVSDAYLFLMALAKQTLEVYIHHANRMAWLAERALEHETRQAYDLIALDYAVNDELTDMTRAQQITGGSRGAALGVRGRPDRQAPGNQVDDGAVPARRDRLA